MPKNDEVTIEQREQVLTPVRVVSVFAEQLGNKTDQDDTQSQPLDLDREVTTGLRQTQMYIRTQTLRCMFRLVT